MSACPWCQAPVAESRSLCPSCGRRLTGLPEPVDEAQVEPAGLELEGAPDLGVPDLKVPSLAPPPMKARPAPPPAAPPARPPAVSGDGAKLPSFAPPPTVPKKKPAAASTDGFSLDDGMEMTGNDYGSIDLAGGMGGEAMPESMGGGALADGPAPVALAAPRPAPVVSVMASEDGGRGAAARLADYGDAPSEWWSAPFYAYRVKMRQMELRRDLADRRADHEKAKSKADDALVVLAERVRGSLTGKDAYSKLLVAVVAAESGLRERDGQLAAATEAHRAQTGALDGKIKEHEAELADARVEAKAYSDVFERVDEVRKRAEAKLQRVDIELRGAIARANPAAAGVPGVPTSKRGADLSSPEVVARTAEREARQAEVLQTMPAVTDAAQKLAVLRKRVTAIEEKILVVKNERAGLEEQFRRRGASHGAQVTTAQKDVQAAMAAVGKAVALDVTTFGSEWTEARREIAALDKVAAAKDDQVSLHIMALDSYDRQTVQRGLGLAAMVVVLVLALVTVPLVMAMSGGKPPPRPPVTLE